MTKEEKEFLTACIQIIECPDATHAEIAGQLLAQLMVVKGATPREMEQARIAFAGGFDRGEIIMRLKDPKGYVSPLVSNNKEHR